jgi:small GTP-binding protein
VGPFQSGKTTLLEAILARTGAIGRQGTVDTGTTVGDASKEARDHRMSVELSVATTEFMGDSYTFVDCPGSVEFIQDMRAALPAVDAAVVVCELDEKKIPQLQLILRELEDQKIPRFLFLNKLDKADATIHDALEAAAAPDPDIFRRNHHRLRRSRARPRLCLQGARALPGRAARRRYRHHWPDRPFLHARNARRP